MSDLLVQFVNLLGYFLWIAMLGRVLASWFNVGPDSPFYPFVNILFQVTEPILAPIRKVLPSFGMLDFSPMVALLLIALVQRVFVNAFGG